MRSLELDLSSDHIREPWVEMEQLMEVTVDFSKTTTAGKTQALAIPGHSQLTSKGVFIDEESVIGKGAFAVTLKGVSCTLWDTCRLP